MIYDINNIFAKIIRKELSCELVYEDEKIIAFNDKYPTSPIHVLVIPRNSYIDYDDFISKATDNEIVYFFKKVHFIAQEILKLKSDGYRLVTNNGAKAGQVIFHFHVHIKSKVT